MKITKQWLIMAHACHNQVEIFDEAWPDGAEITLKNYLRAAELGLDLDWLANNIFSVPALEAYRKAMAQAQKAYDKAIVPAAWKAHDKIPGTAFVATCKKYGTENPGLREE